MLRLFSRYQVLLLGIVWLAAVIVTAGASQTIIHAVKSSVEAGSQSSRHIQVDKRDEPYMEEDIKNIVTQMIKLHPGISIEASGDLIRIKSSSLTNYASWRLAVADVMQAFPGAAVKSLCAGACGGSAFSAEISARRVRFVVLQ